MLPFRVTIPVTVPQMSEIPEGLMNNPVYLNEIAKYPYCTQILSASYLQNL